MALFGNYDRPGRGIPKAPMEKKGIFKFIEVYGRRMWQLMALNLLYLLSIIPIITFGPATCAMTKVARNWSQERNSFMWSDYWEAFKKNFKQGFAMGLIDLIFLIGFSVAIPSYQKWAETQKMMYGALVLCLAFAVVFFLMHFYIYLMIVSTNLTLRQIIKNSLFLVTLGLKKTLWTFLVWIIISFVSFLFFPYSLMIIIFWPLSFLCFVSCFNCYPVVRKYVIQPYYDQRGEENPEFDYLKTEDDAVFTDMGEEKPAPKEEKPQRKTKTIS